MVAAVETSATFSTIRSADGTTIAFERHGAGPPLVLIGGAFNDRRSQVAGVPLAELLADDFSVYAYDRRGRGDSSDTPPYGVQREVEDLSALVAEIGEPVFMWGHSSGAALALEAAAAGLPVSKLAIYEPPYSMDGEAEAGSRVFEASLAALIREDRRGEAVACFMKETGMPAGMIAQIRASPAWAAFEAMAPTLCYDIAILRNGGTSYVPHERVRSIKGPVLALAGSESPTWMRHASRAVADAAARGKYRDLAGHNHMVPRHVVAPQLKAFFKGR
jgi:pimeloyl-ACP methyl ester carboxylesterase